MSENLQCNKLTLWYTPAYIASMCLMDFSGPKTNAVGKKAVRALRCYLEWAEEQSPYQVTPTDMERLAVDRFRETLRLHRKEVESTFHLPDLEVWLT